jgi:hypothetical protein
MGFIFSDLITADSFISSGSYLMGANEIQNMQDFGGYEGPQEHSSLEAQGRKSQP